MGGLFEAGAELAAQRFDVIAASLCGAGEGRIGHQDRGGGVAGQGAAGQALAALAGEASLGQFGVYRLAHLQVGDLQGQLEHLTGGVEAIVEQHLAPVTIQPSDRPHHDAGRQAADPKVVLGHEVTGETVVLGDDLGQPLGGVVQTGKAVAPRRQKPPRLSDGVGRVQALARARRVGLRAPVRQGQLFLAIGGVEPEQRLGHAGEVDRDVGALQRRQVDVGKHRVLQHGLQPGRIVRPAVARQGANVHLVGLGQPQQHLGAERPMVALEQGDVGGRDLQVGSHVALRQAEIPAQSAQAGSDIKPTFTMHSVGS